MFVSVKHRTEVKSTVFIQIQHILSKYKIAYICPPLKGHNTQHSGRMGQHLSN